MDTWHTNWTNNGTQMSGTHASTPINSGAGGAAPCNATPPGGGTWSPKTGAADAPACKALCQAETNKIIQSITVDGVATAGLPKWTAS